MWCESWCWSTAARINASESAEQCVRGREMVYRCVSRFKFACFEFPWRSVFGPWRESCPQLMLLAVWWARASLGTNTGAKRINSGNWRRHAWPSWRGRVGLGDSPEWARDACFGVCWLFFVAEKTALNGAWTAFSHSGPQREYCSHHRHSRRSASGFGGSRTASSGVVTHRIFIDNVKGAGSVGKRGTRSQRIRIPLFSLHRQTAETAEEVRRSSVKWCFGNVACWVIARLEVHNKAASGSWCFRVADWRTGLESAPACGCNVSVIVSHSYNAAMPSIYNLASNDSISASGSLWDTAVVFLQAHEIGSKVCDPYVHNTCSWLWVLQMSCKSASWNKLSLQSMAWFPTWQTVCSF